MFSLNWLILRLSALFLFLGLVFDFEMIVMILGFLFSHMSLGLKQMIYDYIHVKKIKIVYLTLLRISIIEMLSYFLEFLM